MTGVLACAAISLACVSCMGFFSGGSTVIDMDNVDLIQTREPEDGAPTATISTTEGDIEVVLYPENAPKAVESFIKLAESGYYDNTYVFNSEPGVYFAAGSPCKNGDLDEKKPLGAEECEQEISENLWTFRGALCSIPTGESGGWWDKLMGDSKILNGSRFSILNSYDFTEDFKKELLESQENQTLAKKFIELHGVPALAQKITVFGQTYEGFDVIDKLTSLETSSTDEGLNIPVEDVMIKTITIGEYKKTGSWALTEAPSKASETTSTTTSTQNKE